MEKLAEYLRDRGVTKSAFADRIGIAKSTLTELMQGKYAVPLRVAIAIEDATRRKVKARDLLQAANDSAKS